MRRPKSTAVAQKEFFTEIYTCFSLAKRQRNIESTEIKNVERKLCDKISSSNMGYKSVYTFGCNINDGKPTDDQKRCRNFTTITFFICNTNICAYFQRMFLLHCSYPLGEQSNDFRFLGLTGI